MRQRGSIVKRSDKDGNFLCYRIKYRQLDGQQKATGSYKSQDQAQEALTEIMKQMNDGSYVAPTGKTFSEYADEWLKGRVDIKGSTWENYLSYLNVHVKPFLGKTKLTDLRLSHVKSLIALLSQKKITKDKDNTRTLSPSTVRKVITMLKTIFKDAIADGYIRVNPATGCRLPKVSRAKVKPPDKTAIRKVFELADNHSPDVRTMFLLDAMTGLRRGEILALQWRDIDWLNEEALIQRAICKAKATDGVHKWSWILSEPKSETSIRRVGLAPVVLEALRNWNRLSNPVSDQAFVFARNGSFIDPEYFSKWIALPLVKQAGMARFHELRHFFVSMLIDQEGSPKYIQDQVGHADIKTTFNTYGHLMPHSRKEAAAKLEKSLFGDEPRSSRSQLVPKTDVQERNERVN
jgi:integrase